MSGFKRRERKNCRVLMEEKLRLFTEMSALKTEIAWVKKLLFLILGVLIANLLMKGIP